MNNEYNEQKYIGNTWIEVDLDIKVRLIKKKKMLSKINDSSIICCDKKKETEEQHSKRYLHHARSVCLDVSLPVGLQRQPSTHNPYGVELQGLCGLMWVCPLVYNGSRQPAIRRNRWFSPM